MRSLRLPRRLPPPDKHFSRFFCPFGVRYLYPVICDVTAPLISETENYIKEIVASEPENKGELGCLGRFLKFSVVRVTMYQVLHPDMYTYI